MKKWSIIGAVFFSALLILGLSLRYYSYVFSKTVYGHIVRVERVTDPAAMITQGSQIPSSQIYSFAVALRDQQGQIHTASSEDRQWAVAQSGQCAEVRFFRYPPWQLEKAGTFFGARLLRLQDCPEK